MIYDWMSVAIGGAVGAVSRFYLVEIAYKVFKCRFPYGVLACNIIGSLLVGFCFIILVEKMDLSVIWRYAIIVGFLGGFTTFSSFSLDTVQLFQAGCWQKAIVYIFLSLFFCCGATLLGIYFATKLPLG